MKRIVISLAVALALLVSAGTSYADPPYKDKASGSFLSTVIDTNGDGVPGVFGLLQGTSTFGSVTIHFFSEFDLASAAPSAVCPDGYLEAPVVTSNTIYRYQNGDLLFFETASEVFCGNPDTGEFQWYETLDVIGGTGRFTDANGTLEVTGGGIILISDASGVTSFGGVSLSAKGKVSLNSK